MTPGRLKIWNEDAGEWQYTPGGSTPTVKHVVVPVTFAGIDSAIGFADLYLLPENETIMASWPVVTTVFNGTAGGFNFTSAQAAGPNGIGVAAAPLGDAFDATVLSVAVDGIIGPDPTGGPGASTIKMVPLAAPDPGGGSVQTVVDFPAQGGVVTVPGTTGVLEYHLVIAVA